MKPENARPNRFEVLDPQEMAEADRRCIETGAATGFDLMQRAGGALAAQVLARYASAGRVAVLCGPGNNGGDGYVIAEVLRQSGIAVELYRDGNPRAGSDAEIASRTCRLDPRPLADFRPRADTLVVDALYGAGLARPLGADLIAITDEIVAVGCTLVAVDLPSGVSGATGQVLGSAFKADLTVTFVCKKPGHLLLPGRELCGEIVVADIGIPDRIVESLRVKCVENHPANWKAHLPRPTIDTHKYARGQVAVFSGASTATGAARLSAMAAARIGAGAVTVLSPREALAANAAHLTSIMLAPIETAAEASDFIAARRVAALVYGPGLSADAATAAVLLDLLGFAKVQPALVLDASALTALSHSPDAAFGALRNRTESQVMTPHEGEFAKLFPDLTKAAMPSKLERARAAAQRTNCVVVYKGPDTVIAAPDGRAAINSNGTSWLATAGSGDVLAGVVAGLLAQRMPAFDAACAAVWMHAEAAAHFGPGLIAEDLPRALLPVLRSLYADG